ncbi:trypsin-like serine protease [Chromobacterium alkanivorans]|uniref:trypsin-like serine peptidase n=1 Tax=Chromobacterium alkanivorans TaxID=1071719 RepID=UPI001968152F|nr:trypsin-like serine protease [Chromobacterium alkanivorans]MBN3002838.1 trypsin-like serine protease [Chromobacterium alkanivorans]
MKLPLLVLSLLLAPLAHAAPKVSAEHKILFFGQDDRVRTRPDHQPWLAVGQLQTRSRTICTGALVARDVVLTAGHCFVDEKGRFDPAVSFTVGLWGDEYTARSKILEVQVDKGFLKGLDRRADGLYIPPRIAPRDFAFVRLATPLGDTQGVLPVFSGNAKQLRTLLNQQSWTLTQGGYPIDDQKHLLVHNACEATKLRPDGRLTHRCDTLEGNSGSPVFVMGPGQAVIVAVQSSAPIAARRKQEDNMSVSAPMFYDALQQFIRKSAKP